MGGSKSAVSEWTEGLRTGRSENLLKCGQELTPLLQHAVPDWVHVNAQRSWMVLLEHRWEAWRGDTQAIREGLAAHLQGCGRRVASRCWLPGAGSSA